MVKKTRLHVNDTAHDVELDADQSLLSVLREDLNLTGTKYGCGEAQCGTCTVLIDGQPIRSCITKAISVEGKRLTTIEGLEKNGELHPVQQAFLDEDAMQCAFCTSGMIMSAVGFLTKNPNPTDQEIVRFMQGNVCRCGTYPRIMAAIHRVAHKPRRNER